MYDITELFCLIDDFCLSFQPIYEKFLKQEQLRQRFRPAYLALSEILFIAVWYKQSQINNFKAFYQMLRQVYLTAFCKLPCYERLIQLISDHRLALQALHHSCLDHQIVSHFWIDSTSLPVCKNQRIVRHKTLKSLATRGMSSMGWFYGCKLHLLMNQFGELANTQITTGSHADICAVERLTRALKAKIYGDRGYLSKALKEKLEFRGIELFTYHRKNMQAVKLTPSDEWNLRQRNKIETVIGLLKGKFGLISTKQRSISGYLSNIYASLCAYQLCQKNKPMIFVK